MAVLYRKYRPQTFSEVLGQKYTIQTLKNQVESGSVSHAYLFTGSRGVGKTSVARILAKAVNCQKRLGNNISPALPSKGEGVLQGDACGECDVCKAVEQGNFMDLVEIDAASNTGVDNVRDLIEHVKFSPSLGKYKVFIIDEVHMLSKGAFNALLKTLEEPPAHAIFVLATTEIHKVPATIVSRTQRFDFKRLTAGELEAQIEKVLQAEKVKLAKEVVSLISQNAEGSVRDALSLLEKILSLGPSATLEESEQLLGVTDIAVSIKLLGLILGKNSAQLPEFFEELSGQGLDFAIFNRDFLEFLRKILIFKITEGQTATTLAEEHQAQLKDLADLLSLAEVVFFVRLFLRSYKELPFSPSAEIPLLLASLEAEQKVMPNGSSNKFDASVSRHSERSPDLSGRVEESLKFESKRDPSTPPRMHSSSVGMTQTREDEIDVAENIEPTISLEELKKLWPKIISEIKAVNGPLANVVKNSPIQRLSGGTIIVGVKFLFHKQNLETPKNQDIMHKVLQEVTGKNLGLQAELLKEIKREALQTAEILTDALKIFGGELIE